MRLIDGKKQPGEVLTDMWNDISWEGIANEGRRLFPKRKKPEKLIERIIDLTTAEGDWVLIPFLVPVLQHLLPIRWGAGG